MSRASLYLLSEARLSSTILGCFSMRVVNDLYLKRHGGGVANHVSIGNSYLLIISRLIKHQAVSRHLPTRPECD